MLSLSPARRLAGVLSLMLVALAAPVPALANGKACAGQLAGAIPDRPARAPGGTEVMKRLLNASGPERDAAVVEEILSGNLPAFLRHLAPVTLEGRTGEGEIVRVTICVTPEYLAVGDDADFVRVPMGLAAAARVADRLGFILPTPRMVDAIYAQADIRLRPSPMKPGRQMSSTRYLLEHNRTVDAQRRRFGIGPTALTAGNKKDIVLTRRLLSHPGRVAIYGWHRANGRPIQPLSTVHGAAYADYSHGVRLVSTTAYVDGRPVPIDRIMRDPQLAGILSGEGPIENTARLMAKLY